ncbi:hypothetical protein HU200_057155 [Digitaria exilis]|uniref:BTB domain-containing protein n=1 Tax=Digitaria exilis TaxID=1010633 RepID=A0A835E338_9POAL|nr:hypothetical protein HU200_057155 [Digitaria exilis]
MTLTSTHLGDGACSTHLLKIGADDSHDEGFRCKVDGYDWEIRLFHPYNVFEVDPQIMLQLIFLGEATGENGVRAALSCWLVDPTGTREPSPARKTVAASFRRPSDSVQRCHPGAVVAEPGRAPRRALGEQGGGRRHVCHVTFAISGESFAAHKNVLAARSPVFKAEFFGGMMEKSSGHVEIKEMEPSVFEAMLRFLYTNAVPELEDKTMDAVTVALAQRLLVAADRYGLDRLKVMCECRLASAMDTSTAATMLGLAERHGCKLLKPKCVEFIAGGSRENLEAVMETDGFKDLMVNSPSLLAELLFAAHGRKD